MGETCYAAAQVYMVPMRLQPPIPCAKLDLRLFNCACTLRAWAWRRHPSDFRFSDSGEACSTFEITSFSSQHEQM